MPGGLGVDPERIAVGGDSAGGNLATVVAMRCRDAGGPKLALQVLVYPVTNCASFDTRSYREFAEGYHLTRGLMDYFVEHYFTTPEDRSNPEASPCFAANLSGLPPALVITAECDPLCDEGEAYAAQLAAARVTVTCTRYPDVPPVFLAAWYPRRREKSGAAGGRRPPQDVAAHGVIVQAMSRLLAVALLLAASAAGQGAPQVSGSRCSMESR